MTRRTWVLFALEQFLGSVAFLLAPKLVYGSYERLGAVLYFACYYLLLPGNRIGSALFSTFDLYSRYWQAELLLAVIVLNAGFWLLCAASWRLIREHISRARPHRYAITFIAAFVLFVIVNVVHNHLRPATCADCFFPYGVPFHLYHDGGFAGGDAIMWGGLTADILIVAAVAVFFGRAWEWYSGRRAA